MRVPDRVLNESARRAGYPLHQGSLMDYVGGKEMEKNNKISGLLNQKKLTTANRTKYEKQEKTAGDLLTQLQKFATEGDKSIYEKSNKEGEEKSLYQEAKSLTEKYNSLLSALKGSTETLDKFYQESMKGLVADNEKSLAEIGISVSKDGNLSVDEEKFLAASQERVKEVLGAKSPFASKLAFLAERVGDNADANLSSASSSYRPNGSAGSSYLSRYDFRS